MIRFTLNGRPVEEAEAAPDTTLLDWLRARGLTGTKEGCAEGDCGACCVALLDPDAPQGPRWRSINACITLLPAMHGQRLVSVEGLAQGDELHPAQEAMVRTLGSQCGYCTPGFVMSLFEATYRDDLDADWKLDDQLAGNLCRCTGYRPIREAAAAVAGTRPDDPFLRDLAQPDRPEALDHTGGGDRYLQPDSWDALWAARREHPDAPLVAGSTDLGLLVTKQHRRWDCLIGLAALPGMRRLDADADSLTIGAGVLLADLEHWADSELPVVARMLRFFGARPIKNRATVGGNLCTASPIGDLAPVFLALDATAVLRGSGGERRVPMAEFFTDYRQTALQGDELLVALSVPRPGADTRLAAFKVSKRRELDISAVSAAMAVRVSNERVQHIRLAYGGMAATPARALTTEGALQGSTWTEATVRQAASALSQDFQPLSDHRGSAWYRATVAQNLLVAFFEETRQPHDPRLPDRPTGTAQVR